MNKNSKYDDVIKSIQQYDHKQNIPHMYQIILQYEEGNNENEMRDLLTNIFHFSEEEILGLLDSVISKKQIICGSYTKEMFDTKMFEINQLYKEKKNLFSFIIKIK